MKCNSLLWIAHLFLFCCLSHTEHQACNSVCIYTDVRSLRSYFVLLQFFLDLSMQFNLKKYIHMSTSNYRFKRYLLISVVFFFLSISFLLDSIWFSATVLEFWLYQTEIISILLCSWLWGIHGSYIMKYTLSFSSVKWLWPWLMNSNCWVAWEGFYILLQSRGLHFTFKELFADF